MRDEPWNRALMAGFALAMLLLMSLAPMLAVEAKGGDVPEEMPSVPEEQVEYVCPYSTYTAHSLQFNNYSGEILALADWFTSAPLPGTTPYVGMNFTSPYPNGTGVEVLEDKLWINELVPLDMADVNTYLGTSYPEMQVTPIVVLDTDTMSWNGTELTNYLIMGLDEFDANGTIVDRSWFPSYLLDFRIYSSAYIDLEMLGSPERVTVFGFFITNCSRETYWRHTEQFNWTYYTTQKLYTSTLQVENNISTSHFYDVNWYVGYPANRVVDPATLSIWDLDNDLKLTLGEHYDASNAGVWMSFARINMSVTRSFTFSLYGWNATIGLGQFIAYADSYEESTHGDEGYYMAVATGINPWGRIYRGSATISLDLEEGMQRYIAPQSVEVYDEGEGRWLEPWELAITDGVIIVRYAIVEVADERTYDVYFQLDMSSREGWSLDSIAFSYMGLQVSWLAVLVLGSLGLIAASMLRKKEKRSYIGAIIGMLALCMLFIVWFLGQLPGGL